MVAMLYGTLPGFSSVFRTNSTSIKHKGTVKLFYGVQNSSKTSDRSISNTILLVLRCGQFPNR